MEENEIEVSVLKTPKEISDLLIQISGIDIFQKTRERNVVEHRAFFCYLLKEKFDLGPSAISSFMRTQPKLKTYDHATAIHALKMFKFYKPYRKEYFDNLETYFNISADENYQQLPSLENMINKYVLFKSRYYEEKRKNKRQEEKFKRHQEKAKKLKEHIKDLEDFKRKATAVLTENEILYRDLDKKQMQVYDDRAALVLKTFEWKQNNSEYEIINCAT